MPSSTSSFYLPLIDISPFLDDPESPAGRKVVEDLRHACESTGFFQLVGHQVSATLQREVFEASAKFFALPRDTKQALNFKNNPGFRGYDDMGGQSYEDDVLGDAKESFYAGLDVAPDDPRVLNKRFFAGPNVWPDPGTLPHSEFRDVLERYYAEMLKLSAVVLRLVAATLPYGPHIFDEIQANDPACPLRLLHYPQTPAQVAGNKRQLGASAHTDFGLVTLLLTDEHAGLEVLDQETQTWIGVPPKKDAYIVNLADIMTKITSGRYKSSVHRVLNQAPVDRYSVVFFFDGNLDCKLRELEKLNTPVDPKEKLVNVDEYIMGRFSKSYALEAAS